MAKGTNKANIRQSKKLKPTREMKMAKTRVNKIRKLEAQLRKNPRDISARVALNYLILGWK